MRRNFNQITPLSKGFNNVPWNFNAQLLHKKVQNLVLPISLDHGFLSNDEAVSLFKDYADAI